VRRRFSDLIARQLDLFVEGEVELIAACQEALDRYNAAGRDEAEELYGDYLDLFEAGTGILADMRDAYAASLEDQDAEEYEAAFNRAVAKRLSPFALEIENR
jgi:hypothetical protein